MRAWRIAGLALEGLRRTPLRVTLTTLGVAIASGALVSMVAFALGLQQQIEAPFRMLDLLNNIQVYPKEGEIATTVPPLDDDAVVRLEQLPGVAAAYPDIRVRGVKVRFGQRAESGLAIGIPREASLFGVAEEILVAGSFFGEEKKPEAILGIQLVHGLGFDRASDAVGIQLTLESAGLTATDSESFTFQRKQLVVTVVGVYNVPAILPGVARQGILLPVELMKQLPGTRVESALSRLKAGATPSMSGYSSVTVRVRHPSDLEPVARQIDALGYRTSTMLGRLREMRSFLILLQILLAAVGSVALVVAALGIVNTLLMAVLERYQEIGIYKAIGASDGDVFVLFVTEAAVIGLLGSLGGLVLGRLVSWGLGLGIGLYARSQGAPEGLDLFAFPVWLLGGTVAFSVLISVLAGVYPALRAARLDPIRALRRE